MTLYDILMIFWLGCVAPYCARSFWELAGVGSENKKPQPKPGLSWSEEGDAGRKGVLVQRDYKRGQRCFVAKVCETSANNLESVRRSHGKFSSLAFLH